MYSLGIIDDITEYERVGAYLLNDNKGNIIRNLREDHRYVSKIVNEMFYLWLNEKGATPVTWAGLVDCLKLAELNALADKIESAYQCAEKSHGSHETVTVPPIIPMNENLVNTEYGELLATMGITIFAILPFIRCFYWLSGLFLKIISHSYTCIV